MIRNLTHLTGITHPYNIYKYLGYNVTGVNHLGDYGTQFGKLIEGYKMWGKEYDIEKDPINELTKIYIRINEACKNDEQILENCRNNFKKLEDGDSYCVEIWKKFRELSLQEFQKVYDFFEYRNLMRMNYEKRLDYNVHTGIRYCGM